MDAPCLPALPGVQVDQVVEVVEVVPGVQAKGFNCQQPSLVGLWGTSGKTPV